MIGCKPPYSVIIFGAIDEPNYISKQLSSLQNVAENHACLKGLSIFSKEGGVKKISRLIRCN